MAATIEQIWDANDEVIAAISSADVAYNVHDVADEAEVRAAAATLTPTTYNGMPRRSTRIEARLGPTEWRIRVHYEPYERSPSSYSFEIGGGTQHVTNSIATVGAYGAPGVTPPNLQGAIGYDGERVNGIDINVPVFSFSETHYFDADDVDQAYKLKLFNLCSTMNNAAFRGHASGECLFVGASGTQREGEKWELTYRFSASPNRTGISVGAITGIAKLGWHYLWVLYGDDESAGFVIKRPVAAYVEQVYQFGNFAELQI